MNKLPFKLKILVSVSILFILLIAPSYGGLMDFIQKKNSYNRQLIGLDYVQHLQNIIETVQIHRGLSNGYFNGNLAYRQKIITSENILQKKIIDFIDFDEKHLHLLKRSKSFVNALSLLEAVKLNHITKEHSTEEIFKTHNQIIHFFIKTLKETAQKSSFDSSDDIRIKYIAQILDEKLLLLQEYTGQIRGLATGIFTKKKVTEAQIEELLKLYTLINSMKMVLLDNNVLLNTDNYITIQKETIYADSKLKELLFVVNKNIIVNHKLLAYNGNLFFKKASEAINAQTKLYQLYAADYRQILTDMQKQIYLKYGYLLAGFLLIILVAFYIFGAFYHSVTGSLKKLQLASKMIAEGKTDIHIKADTKDEISDALLAFNHMSHKLNENISFLNGYKMAIDETSIVSKTNKKGIITYVNKMFCEISGYSKEELLGFPHNIVRHPETPKEAFEDLWKTIKAGKIWKGIIKNRRKNGDYYIVDATVIPILDEKGEVLEYVAVRHDITELEKSKEELKKQKLDFLTALPNRNQLLEDLKKIPKPILFYFNIDAFAALNDFYGTDAGDKVLLNLAELLKEIAKSSGAKVYKLHADGFILLFEEGKIDKKNYHQAYAAIVDYIESRVLDCISDNCISITLSGSVVFYDADKDYEKLLAFVDVARKFALKENKKFMLYNEDMRKEEDYANNITWINKIKEAIAQDRIVPFFQPIVDNSIGAVTKYEALVRFVEKDGKVISPFFFLDIAKKANLYTQITKIVIDKAFKKFENLPQYEFSINISVEDIHDEDVSSYIYYKLQNYRDPQRVVFEITESEEIKDYTRVNIFIERIKSYGAKISIDDFGSGYANFEHILSLKADYIKIDGSLVKNIDTDEHSRIIIEAIIAFCKKLGSKTIVEYVHNESVSKKVIALGADYSQGFFLGKPSETIAHEHLLANSTEKKQNIR
jgi:PAS domain S-box-containing protein